MTARVQGLIKEFERLSEEEKHEAVSEILRRSKRWGSPSLTDDELAQAVDDLFLEMDRAEGHEDSASR